MLDTLYKLNVINDGGFFHFCSLLLYFVRYLMQGTETLKEKVHFVVAALVPPLHIITIFMFL
jgi:hypothetical protein